MQEDEQPLEGRMGCYTIEYINQASTETEKELFDTVFSKLEKIQRRVMLERIKKAESQLASLEDELSSFLATDEQ